MKKMILIILVLCLLPIYAFAETADDIITALGESSKASVKIATIVADANHKDGSDSPYILNIHTPEGKMECSLEADEYLKLCAWVDGNYSEDGFSYEVDKYVNLVSLEEFVYYFNFYGALLGDGHELSIEKAFDFKKMDDKILFKTIFNDCEILSLMLSADASEVKSIHCTWARNMQGASDYLNDFLQMLTETLLACGMESDSISSLFTSFGEANTFNVGDKGEMTIDGIKVSYEVTSYSGVSFKIERE